MTHVGQIVIGAPRVASSVFLGWTGAAVPNGSHLYGRWTVPAGGGSITAWFTGSRSIFGVTTPGWKGEVQVNGAVVLTHTTPTPTSTPYVGISTSVTPIALAAGDLVEFRMYGPCHPLQETVGITVMTAVAAVIPIGPVLLP